MDEGHKRLLVVDDESTVREVVMRALRRAGFTDLDEAADGAAALERLRAQTYHLVISDWEMPRLDGRGLLEALRTPSGELPVPVLVISGSGTEEARAAGATATLAKPITPGPLVDLVRELLKKGPAQS
jgi:two-component system chemotaxis response regulator CheY